MKKISSVLLLLFLMFLLLCAGTFVLIRQKANEEIRELSDRANLVSEIKSEIPALLSKCDTGIRVYPKKNMTIAFPGNTSEIQNSYNLGIRHYQARNTEYAIHYFENVLEKGKDQPVISPWQDPYLFSALFLYRIYHSTIGNKDPDLRRIILEGLCDGHLEPLIISAITEKNSDLFTTAEIRAVKSAVHFHENNLEKRIDFSNQAIFCFTEKFSYIYNSDSDEIRCADQETLLALLNELSLISKDFLISLSLSPETDTSVIVSGIYLDVSPGPQMKDKVRSINLRYLTAHVFMVLLYTAVLFTVGRYIIMLKQMEEMKDSFLNIISHELKTPLSGIRIYADTLAKTGSRDKISEYARIISAKTVQITNIIANLLYFNKISGETSLEKLSENLSVSFADIDIHQLVSEICRDYAISYQKEYQLDFPDKDNLLFTDRNILSIIFSNLVDNSFKYCGNSVNIRIRSIREKNSLKIIYTDNGVLNDNFNTSGLFKKFSRLDTTGKTGLGLGLYIVKKLSGLLDAAVSAENQGSLVIIINFQVGK